MISWVKNANNSKANNAIKILFIKEKTAYHHLPLRVEPWGQTGGGGLSDKRVKSS